MNPFLEFHSKYNIYKNSMRKKKLQNYKNA